MSLSLDHILTTVETYLARHPHEREHLGALLGALERPTHIASRSTFIGHITCGAVVIDSLGRVLHVLHLTSGKVLAPGGHAEPSDESLAGTALRRLHEETGIPLQAVAPWPGYETVPFDIDIHDIDAHPGRAEPGHQHFDLRFLFRLHTAAEPPVVLQEEEVGGIEWRPVDRVVSPSLRDKLLKLPPPKTDPERANASALIYNDHGEYLLHLRDYFPGRIWEPGMWSLLGGGREPQDATLEHTLRRELAEEAGLAIADLAPFGTEYARDDAGASVPITIYAGRWNGDPRELRLTEGVMLSWFAPDDLHRLRIAPTTTDLVRRHAAGLPARTAPQSALAPQKLHRPAPPHGTVLNVIGVHLHLERPDGTVLLGLRHPDSAFAPSTWHVLAGHCEQENAIACLLREAREEAGLHIERQDVELVHVIHHVDKAGDRPRIGLFFRARTWSGEPELREPDKCTQWRFWDPAALPDNLVSHTRQAIAKIQNGDLYSESGWPA
ncbi:putative MutT family protein [Streptomyces ambofaciens ATCC 23877]|uniref:Putative MutT family protein n=1 Tax=Streptomyces ambofaciens (strain ATCC 23877 / 3486 / DSM 40053 / JCM 4204 / NBRC 12836 / NRRL B-2516) TaxID=278992 RepID=A3KHV1_STRA7|nr:NUDIX domain-containing protein [Streptomyces ambofaciens]AKZ53386.1 putative MutT family protein [Streptomyces ambofaciens ATCC 23877]CAJ89277.1 putative MutT family protein [Streptomyces ambofaciens ATCC 23877]